MNVIKLLGRSLYDEISSVVLGRPDPLIALTDMAMRMRRTRAQLHEGPEFGVEVIRTEAEFKYFAIEFVKGVLTRTWGKRQFHLLAVQVDELRHWESMKMMNAALKLHDSYAKVTNTRDVYVINGLDYFLCEIHICLEG